MTKRFTIADYPTHIVDNQTNEKYACSSYTIHMEIICDLLNFLSDENEELKQQVEDLEFALRTKLAYQRVEKEEHSDSVYDFKKKLDKW